MRIATWNIKQAMAPKKPLDVLWSWAADRLNPDCMVFTEAKVPKEGVPSGWEAHWNPDGVYPDKRNGNWGTVVASRGVSITPVTGVKGLLRNRGIEVEWPAAVQVVDLQSNGEYWGTVVGFYAVTKNGRGESTGNGRYSWPRMMKQLKPLFDSDRGERIIVAGDLNLWPSDLDGVAEGFGLTDLIEHTVGSRPKIQDCVSCEDPRGCHHMWTHKNEGGKPRADGTKFSSVQQIDYIFASRALVKEFKGITGGDADFPDAWELSDHAPVVAEFR